MNRPCALRRLKAPNLQLSFLHAPFLFRHCRQHCRFFVPALKDATHLTTTTSSIGGGNRLTTEMLEEAETFEELVDFEDTEVRQLL